MKTIANLFPAERVAEVLIALAQALRAGIFLVVLYFYLSLVFSFFPWTRGFAERLLNYVLSPLKSLYEASVGYLPSLFFVAVISGATWYLLKFIQLIFEAVRRLPG